MRRGVSYGIDSDTQPCLTLVSQDDSSAQVFAPLRATSDIRVILPRSRKGRGRRRIGGHGSLSGGAGVSKSVRAPRLRPHPATLGGASRGSRARARFDAWASRTRVIRRILTDVRAKLRARRSVWRRAFRSRLNARGANWASGNSGGHAHNGAEIGKEGGFGAGAEGSGRGDESRGVDKGASGREIVIFRGKRMRDQAFDSEAADGRQRSTPSSCVERSVAG